MHQQLRMLDVDTTAVPAVASKGVTPYKRNVRIEVILNCATHNVDSDNTSEVTTFCADRPSDSVAAVPSHHPCRSPGNDIKAQ